MQISAVTTLDQIARSKIIRKNFSALAMAAGLVGSQQIRNIATIGGNICNASPAADTLAPLLAFDANLILRSTNASRSVPIEDFFVGPGTTIMKQNEVLQTIVLRKSATVSRYYKLARRKAVDLAIVGVAVVRIIRDDVRIAVSAAGPKVYRARTAEEYIRTNAWNNETIERAASLTKFQAHPISDVRASAQYRKEMVNSITRKLLKELPKNECEG